MDMRIDMRVAELLASRLCHDLVGPIGAVNNGLELMAEGDGDDMSGEALHLVADAAGRAAGALQLYRLAYGMAGSRLGGDLREVREVVAGYLGHGKASLDWAAPERLEEAPDGFGKLLINMILLGQEALPLGGTISVAATQGQSGLQASVAASGDRAGLLDESRPALADEVDLDELTPRSVQVYFTRLLARRLGTELALETTEPNRVEFSVALPGAAA